MSKRKRSKEDKYEYIKRKLRKLEKKLKKDHKESSSSGSSSDEKDDSPVDIPIYQVEDDEDIETPPVDIMEPILTPMIEQNLQLISPVIESIPSTGASVPAAIIEEQEGEPAENYILELLGDDPSITKAYSKEINADLAVRLQHFVTAGLSKEVRRNLQAKYLPPSNCTLIDAPTLNPEIKAAVTDIVLKRDRGIEMKQKELGSAIAGIGEAISILLKEQDKNTLVIKLLMDASRLICDCQNTDSITRRNYILYNLKKDLKEQIRKTKIDNLLFGSDLPETLKVAKSISKSGADLKSTPAPIQKIFRQTNLSRQETLKII